MSKVLTNDHLLCYTEHLRMVKADMEICFRDMVNSDVPDWVAELFQGDVFQNEAAIKDNLTNIQNN